MKMNIKEIFLLCTPTVTEENATEATCDLSG